MIDLNGEEKEEELMILLEILLKIKNNKDYLVRPDKWWKERAIIARALIYKKKYELAYKISSKHSLETWS